MSKKVTIIQNEKGLQLRKTFRELYEYRELLWMLAWRDFRVRYAQTFLGFAWAILEPLATAVLLSLVFNKVANASTLGIEPILFGMTGMLCWNYFANVVSQGNTSLIISQNMIKKIYFPRIIIPLSKAIAALPDLLITLIFTLILILTSKKDIQWTACLLPLHLFFTIVTAATFGLWFSALNIRFRDFKHVVPFFIRMGLFITPIAYSTIDMDKSYKWVFFLNPMTGIIENLRWALWGIDIESKYLWVSSISLIVFLITGLLSFFRLQKNIADVI
jgi:lipopolysaccharide transport system permease protein